MCVSAFLVFRDGCLILLYVLRAFGVEAGSAQELSRGLDLNAMPHVVTKLVVLSA